MGYGKNSDDRAQRDEVVKSNHLDFLYELYVNETPIDDESLSKLIEAGYVKEKQIPHIKNAQPTRTFRRDYSVGSEKEIAADQRIDVEQGDTTDTEVLTEEQYLKKTEELKYEGRKDIKTEEWKPLSVTEHSQAFVHWIDSINTGFQNRRNYKEFNLYRQQAMAWLAENKSAADYDDSDDRKEFYEREFSRCDQNSLYFLNRYVFLKEGDIVNGSRKYEAKPVHDVIAFVLDCGYSIEATKGRQIAFTSTIGGIAVKKIVFNKNFFLKYIAQDKEKGVEIFEDKIKFVFSELPPWMKPDVSNDRDNLLAFSVKEKKGTRTGVNSKLQVVAPTVSAINGGSPNLVMIDEAGYINILSKMIKEARPTLFSQDSITKKLVMKRQICIWGCVCAGTKVWDNEGRILNIEDLKQSDGILGYDGHSASKENISWMKPPAKKPCYRITTSGGNKIECSNDHPLFWSRNKWDKRICGKKHKKVTIKEAEDVRVGDQLMMINAVPVFGKKKMWNPRLVGLLIGDGSYGENSNVQIGGQDVEIHEYLLKNFDAKEKIEKTYITKSGKIYKSFRIRKIAKELRTLGIFGQTKGKKTLPKNIHRYSKKSLCELIAGLFDADGNIKVDKRYGGVSAVLTSAYRDILESVKFQMVKIGVHSHICKEKRTKSGGWSGADMVYRLYVTDHESILNFQKNIKSLIKHKQGALDYVATLTTKSKKGADRFTFVDPKTGKGRYFIGRDDLAGMRHEVVKRVEYIGKKEIYNLTAETTHTYLSNNFINANTGGEMEKGGKSFEGEYLSVLKLWRERDFSSGIIPLFFDWTCRPGITPEMYESERRVYYSVTGTEMESSQIQFHQHYPTTIDDVFMTSAKTLVGKFFINEHLDKIRKLGHPARPKHGYFEPIFDTKQAAADNSDVPYVIIGAQFVPTEDVDGRASVIIFQEPNKRWADRYYQGTDPIASDNGLSKMSSAIFDNHFRTISAVVNYRDSNYKYCFLQTLLLGLYYDTQNQGGVKELLEANIGLAYRDYKDNKGFFRSLVYTSELPDAFQNQTTNIGIDNKGKRATMIVNKMYELIQAYGKNIFIEEFWLQLKTFVCQITAQGNTVWGPADKRLYRDDILFSCTFAYICSLCYPNRLPRDIGSDKHKYVTKSRMIYDKNYNLVRVTVREKVSA